MNLFYKRLEAISPLSLQQFHQFDLCFSVLIQQLIFFVCLFTNLIMNSTPFLVPIILSVHISLGFYFEPVCLSVPVTRYGFSQRIFLLNHTNYDFSYLYISTQFGFRPVHSQIRQLFI